MREHAGGIIAGGVGKDCASNGAAAGANAKVHKGSAVAEVKVALVRGHSIFGLSATGASQR